MLKLGTVALDGTKMHANASRHSALSYEHARKIEAQLKAELRLIPLPQLEPFALHPRAPMFPALLIPRSADSRIISPCASGSPLRRQRRNTES